MHKFYISMIFCALVSVVSAQDKLPNSDMQKIDFAILANSKQKIKEHNQSFLSVYNNLLKACNKSLLFKPFSVMEKDGLPPSGDKHDYMSIAPYWWPDSTKKNGSPYIRRDGLINPEVNQYKDKLYLADLCEKVYELGLGFYLSDNPAYAKKAVELLDAWFLNPATKMNPNLNYAQAVKGVAEGRAEGVIDTRHFIFMLDGVKMISHSVYWTNEKDQALKQWFRSFYTWMNQSKVGMEELNAKNNHGVWFDAQALSITIYLDSLSESKKIINRSLGRLEAQMDSKGAFPLELARTTSLHYSCFILEAFENVAQLSQDLNIDFRNMHTTQGMTLKNAFDFILPYLKKEKEWELPQIKKFETSNAYPLLYRAYNTYGCKKCMQLNATDEKYFNSSIYRLLSVD